MKQNGLPFLAKYAAVLVPASLSLTGRAAGWLVGDPGASSISLTVLATRKAWTGRAALADEVHVALC